MLVRKFPHINEATNRMKSVETSDWTNEMQDDLPIENAVELFWEGVEGGLLQLEYDCDPQGNVD